MGEFSVWHWIVVAIVFLALFGYRKLPDAARSLGRSMRIFKAEMREMRDDPVASGTPGPSPTSPTSHPAPPQHDVDALPAAQVVPPSSGPADQPGTFGTSGVSLPASGPTARADSPQPRDE